MKCEKCEVNYCEECALNEKNKCIKCESGKFLSTDKLSCGINCLVGNYSFYIFLSNFKII